jgi:signal transduction histidine kinase
MQSIRRRLSFILIICTITAVVLSALFVNTAMNSTFNKYMNDVQNQRYTRIVEYFQQVYKKDGKWNKNSGEELMHDAYMSNYCLTLLDENKNVVWGMNPSDIRNNLNIHPIMGTNSGKGVYTSKTFGIIVNRKTVGYAVVGQYNSILMTEQDINFKNSINNGIMLSALITIIITAVLSIIISKQFSMPIKRVSDTSVQLSNGNYETRSDINSSIVEINNLIKSINLLGEKLNNQSISRKRLVSDISHEIRTPLNVLQNNIEAMIDGIFPITEDRLNSLNEEVIRFGKLLNNLNSLKQFEVEDSNLNFETLCLNNLIKEVCEDFKSFAKEKNVNIIFGSEEKQYLIPGDKDKLKQVFINLISNAIKYNKNNGSLMVHINESENKVIVKIKDTGMGIKKEDVPYIFERLYRGDKSKQQLPGSGLGLSIVKKILNLHSAEIYVESKINKGSTFTLSFNKKHN